MNTNTTRTRQFHIRLNEQEHALMHQRAREAGFPLSHFVRDCGLHGRVCPVPAINLEQWSYLAGTTSNLNQLVHLCHKGTVPQHLDATILETARLLHEVRTRLLGKN